MVTLGKRNDGEVHFGDLKSPRLGIASRRSLYRRMKNFFGCVSRETCIHTSIITRFSSKSPPLCVLARFSRFHHHNEGQIYDPGLLQFSPCESARRAQAVSLRMRWQPLKALLHHRAGAMSKAFYRLPREK